MDLEYFFFRNTSKIHERPLLKTVGLGKEVSLFKFFYIMGIPELLTRFSGGHRQLVKQLYYVPEQAIHYKPTPETWSISDIIVHLADSETYGFIRAKKIIAESGESVTVYNQQIWADHLFYNQMNYLDALELIRLLRKNLYNVLKLLSPETWQNYVYHPETGKITLFQWIQSNIDHVDVHAEQIHQNHEDWKRIQVKTLQPDFLEQAVSYFKNIKMF